MTTERVLKKSSLAWFIGIQVYGPKGSPKWIVRGPFDYPEDLSRAQSELKAINKVTTKPYQATSLAQARKMCAAEAER